MSFMRAGHELEHFVGISDLYVYPSEDGIVDYGATYNNKAAFCELLVRMVRKCTDEEYAMKIAKVLAKDYERWGVELKDG